MKLKLGLYQIVLVSFLLLNSGCKTINAVVPPSTDLTFNASADINPDINDRPSPVVVKIFELSSRTIFDTQDFFTLDESAESVLGPDLIRKDELELQPSETREYAMTLGQNTRFVGVIVAYRDIDSSRWRSVVAVDPTGYDDVVINIEKIAVYNSEK
ncbi:MULTISPECIES: type VI secretion system lipoprotein TssJ [unclassified Shewanella]|jgi:type VI secretion system protein VasD|uniref:type VI secretion system lipoprotein TssJ n=1 Tax=unclassified Shewanella TaxID=196818 RepID=UPI000C323246|nr:MULTISPECIES: type VI secretion system lipoprotein TssJ [unclassified Shewanella]MBO1895140.1 type VI secretion system lipoprotein TssJ [Shewanella sp. BF02_Schw]PKH32366.1 type VI secretion system lipoprotein TssJ [Shewanella sp. ALD9]QHS13894.1 type VI secretion system lipoprotein TssJ [Shewanella sp. Arc9-LZ]